jgi:hypothetical protein
MIAIATTSNDGTDPEQSQRDDALSLFMFLLI